MQPDSAGVLPVGAEKRRRVSPGALGVGLICPADQPLVGSTSSVCVLF